MKQKKLESMIDYKYPTIASGATLIGSACHAPNEELLWEERGRKFRVHGLNIYYHRESRLCMDKIIQEPKDFGHYISQSNRRMKN
jgi:hypothetical protein